MTTPFVHLRVHTEYSLVDGLLRLKPLVKQASGLGMPALAVTDALWRGCQTGASVTEIVTLAESLLLSAS